MSKYTLMDNLSSYKVNKQLIEDLEAYFFKKLPKMVNILAKEIKDYYTVSISENLGTETLKSIKNYDLPMFSSSTDLIELEIYIEPRDFRIAIKFAKEKNHSEYLIKFSGKSAKGIVTGIKKEIIDILEPYKTINNIFHVIKSSNIITIVVFYYFIGYILSVGPENFDALIFPLPFIFILFLFFGVGPYLNPFTVFDSRKTQRYENWSNFLYYGIISFVVFQVLFPWLLSLG